MTPNLLVATSAAIIGLLGLAHLVLTFRGPKLRPRDESLIEAMSGAPPVITKQTTIWRMWLGFNASHAAGAMLFGLTFSYLALAQGEVFFASVYLQAVGFAMLAGFTLLAKLYWFITPFAGASLSLVLYGLGIVLAAGA